MSNTKSKKALKYILIFCALSLLFAYFVEFILKHKPCNLCLIERIPYIGSIILITAILIINKFEKLFLKIIIIFFVSGAVISFYHFGIEQGFFNESLVCELEKIQNNLSATDLLKKLETKIISCKDVNFKLFGLSLATINIFVSLSLSVIVVKILNNHEKN